MSPDDNSQDPPPDTVSLPRTGFWPEEPQGLPAAYHAPVPVARLAKPPHPGFWFSLLWGIIGAIIFVLLALIIIGIIIGYAIWVATTIWVLYRLVRGYMLFNESKPVPGM